LFRVKNSFCQSFRLAAGVGYLKTTYHVYNNYKNTGISTPFNAAINMSFISNYNLSDRIDVLYSLGLCHFSNGSVRMPNKGL